MMHYSMYILSLNSLVISIKPKSGDNFHIVTVLFYVLRKKYVKESYRRFDCTSLYIISGS